MSVVPKALLRTQSVGSSGSVYCTSRTATVSPYDVGGINGRFKFTGQRLAETKMSIVERAIDLENNRRPTVVKFVWENDPEIPEANSEANFLWENDSEISGANSNQIIPSYFQLLQQALATDADILKKNLHPLLQQALAREASILEQNLCPLFPQLYEYGHWENCHFIAMEDIKGLTLKALINNGIKLPLYRAIEIAMQVCYGLNALHQAGFAHRDVKPENIIVNGSYVRLIDFGIACEKGYQNKGLLVGTPPYLAPEQYQRQSLDQRTDIYALGLVLAQMITSVKTSKMNDVIIGYSTEHKTIVVPDQAYPAADLEADLETVERKRFDCLNATLQIDNLGKRFSEEKATSLKEKIDQAQTLLQQIIDKMLQFKKEDRFNNINQLPPLLKKALKIARKLAPYESLA